jgi:multiple sugar transport system permease protein
VKRRESNLTAKLNITILTVLSLLVILPLWFIISGSFMGVGEIRDNFSPVLTETNGKVIWPILPAYPTLRAYVELLIDTPKFFIMFWNSCNQVFPALLGQFFIAVPGAWAFARFEFKGKKALFTLYMTLMIMPFQVTMVSTYLVLDRFNFLDSHLAIILPAVFSTFPVFIMVKFFKSIPKSLIEAAKIDGAGEWRIFSEIGIPMGASGIISALILDFLELWNTIEQPLNFLKSKSLWPLSLYLPNISIEKAGISLVASVLMLLPALLLFLYGQKYLEEGIMASGLKE